MKEVKYQFDIGQEVTVPYKTQLTTGIIVRASIVVSQAGTIVNYTCKLPHFKNEVRVYASKDILPTSPTVD